MQVRERTVRLHTPVCPGRTRPCPPCPPPLGLLLCPPALGVRPALGTVDTPWGWACYAFTAVVDTVLPGAPARTAGLRGRTGHSRMQSWALSRGGHGRGAGDISGHRDRQLRHRKGERGCPWGVGDEVGALPHTVYTPHEGLLTWKQPSKTSGRKSRRWPGGVGQHSPRHRSPERKTSLGRQLPGAPPLIPLTEMAQSRRGHVPKLWHRFPPGTERAGQVWPRGEPGEPSPG